MSDVLSLYFDGSIVQAVRVRLTGNSVTVSDARTFPALDLDDYLALSKEKNCIICSNPSLFYQDIIHLPPAADKLYDKLVRTELLNIHPDLTSFSIFYRVIGESMIDGKPYNKVAAFSYPDDFLSNFITELTRYGMKLAKVYPAAYSVFKLALSTCPEEPDQTRIFIASLLGEKLLLVSENGKLEFIRKIPSLDNTLLPEDSNNINMTVDYCFQSLRIRPCEAVMLNQPERSGELDHLISVPYRTSAPPALNGLPSHIVQDYLAPVAAALHSVTDPHSGNILPSGYAAFTLHKRILTTAAMVMVVLALLCGWYLVKESMAIAALNTKINRLRTELSGSANELATFRKLDEEVNRLKQPLESVNRHNALLNPATALAALKLPETPEYVIRGVSVSSGDAALNVNLQGVINASIYSDTQAVFESLVAGLAKLPGYSVVSSAIDIKQKTFSIQTRYVGKGQSAK